MHDLDRLLLAVNETVHVHEAAHVSGRHDFGSGLFVIVDAVEAHHAGDRFFGDGERAAEAAAFVGSLQRDEFDSFEAGQKLPRLVEGRDHPFTP